MMTTEELTARVQQEVPLAGALGITVRRAGPDEAELWLPPSALSLRPGATASGPAMMTLADVAIWVPALVAAQGADVVRTAQLQITFLRPAGSLGVRAEVRVVRRGRTSLYADVWLYGAGQEKPCAHVTSNWLRAAPG